MDRRQNRWAGLHQVRQHHLTTHSFFILQATELSCLTHSRFSTKYGFEKPNDKRALELMNAAARAVMAELPDIAIAYGVSDEFRCAFSCTVRG